ncbi:fungal-specific transcription factor domain-containing protein [Trichoderma velutinum]
MNFLPPLLYLPCDYTNRQSENELKARIQELESLVATHVGRLSPQPQSTSTASSRDTTSFSISQSPCGFYPAALRFQKLFLDTDILTRPDAPPPPSSDMIPAAVWAYLGDQAQSTIIMSQYFQTIHKWMPIISRVRLTSLADLELGNRPRADFALLLLTMKLIQDVPGSSSNAVRDALYICAKEFAASLEIAGVYTLLKLQANLLISVYEMGHGIFPAAYVSVGCCVTQAMVLGIHNREAPQILEQPRTWIDWEERQRVWWLVVILERYITSAGDNRPLLSADPNTTSHLPVNDDSWDSGQAMYPERLILSSSKHLSASPFARLAQASHLQGEVIKHCNDDTRSLALVQNDVEVLSQVLWSFLEVIGKDRSSMMHFYSSVGVCLRALDVTEMALAREIALRCQSIMKDCIVKAMSFIEVLGDMVQDQESIENLASLSPWFLDSIYQCLANIVYLMATTPAVEASGYPSQVSLCMDLLRKANQRWNVAGAYLEAIDLIEHELKVSHY